MPYQYSPPPRIYPSFGEAYNKNMIDRNAITKHAYNEGYDPNPEAGANTGRMVFSQVNEHTGETFNYTPGGYNEYVTYVKKGGYKTTNKYKKGRKTKTRRSKGNRKQRIIKF